MWNKIYSGLATFGVYYALFVSVIVTLFVIMGGYYVMSAKGDYVCLNEENTVGVIKADTRMCYTKCRALGFLIFMLLVVWGLYWLTIKYKPVAFVRGGLGVYDIGSMLL